VIRGVFGLGGEGVWNTIDMKGAKDTKAPTSIKGISRLSLSKPASTSSAGLCPDREDAHGDEPVILSCQCPKRHRRRHRNSPLSCCSVRAHSANAVKHLRVRGVSRERSEESCTALAVRFFATLRMTTGWPLAPVCTCRLASPLAPRPSLARRRFEPAGRCFGCALSPVLQSRFGLEIKAGNCNTMNEFRWEQLWGDGEQLRLTVVVPTYNEADNLPAMAEALLRLGLPNLQLLIVDDNSPDGTGASRPTNWRRVYNQSVPDLASDLAWLVMHRQGKGGLGTAYVAGYEPRHGRWRRLYRADGCRLQSFAALSAADAGRAAGHRSRRGDRQPLCAGRFARRRVGVEPPPAQLVGQPLQPRHPGAAHPRYDSGLQDVAAQLRLQTIGLENIRSNGYSFQVEMAYLCEKLGFRLVEIPIHFEDRRIGQSKLDVPVKLESAWRTWQIRWQYRHLAPGRSPRQAARRPTNGARRRAFLTPLCPSTSLAIAPTAWRCWLILLLALLWFAPVLFPSADRGHPAALRQSLCL
jgi:dolichol-phosphate mannosyltransferase